MLIHKFIRFYESKKDPKFACCEDNVMISQQNSNNNLRQKFNLNGIASYA